MSIPDSGAEPLPVERSGTSGTTTRGASVSAPRASDSVTTGSTSSTRTPPPRTRRGAEPTTDGTGTGTGAGAGAKTKGPKPTPESTKVFNWDDDGVASASTA